MKYSCALILAALILVGCQSKEQKIAAAKDKPADVVRKFYEALQKKNSKQASLYMTTKYMGKTIRYVPGIGSKVLGVILLAEELMAQKSEYKILSENTTGDKSVVRVERYFIPDKTKTQQNLYLYFDRDGWYIARIGGDTPPWEPAKK